MQKHCPNPSVVRSGAAVPGGGQGHSGCSDPGAARRDAERRLLARREARRAENRRNAAREAEARAWSEPQFRGFYAEYSLAFGAMAETVGLGVARLVLAGARALHRAYRVRRETREASVLGVPTPADLRAVWVPPRRTLRQALLIGSKLVDLTPTHSSALKWGDPDEYGRRRIVGRGGGLKRYLADACPEIRYATAMRYRQLAQRTLRVLETPAAVPLEWLLDGNAPGTSALDAALAGAVAEGRRRLAELLVDVRNQRELSRRLDRRLDSDRLPLARRSTDPRHDEAACRAILERCGAKLDAALAAGRPLTREERKALRLLESLRRRMARSGAPPGQS